jgi:hypothetical protein
MANSTDRTRLSTGKCTVIYAFLNKPNTKFKEEGEYSIKVRLSKEEGEAILGKIIEIEDDAFQKAYDEALKESKKKANSVKRADSRPCAEERDDDDNPTGFYTLNCKMKASGKKKDGSAWARKPAIYDAKLALITDIENLVIYSGSEVRVGLTLSPFISPIGVGVSANLDGVQIIKLVSGGRTAEDMGFVAEEDGYEARKSNTAEDSSSAAGLGADRAEKGDGGGSDSGDY